MNTAELQAFHQRYKLLLMAHAPDSYQALGRVAANSDKKRASELFADYQKLFLESINRAPTRKQWTNVLQHIFGYFKLKITPPEKQQILETIEEYRRGELPLIAALTLLRHLVRKYSIVYLIDQAVFEPYPKQLQLILPSDN